MRESYNPVVDRLRSCCRQGGKNKADQRTLMPSTAILLRVLAVSAVLFFTTASQSAEKKTALPSSFVLDLDADTDHTGFIEHSQVEDDREDADGEEGVIVLPNWDDDDPPGAPGHGVPDCLVENTFSRVNSTLAENGYDNRINGEKDKEDLRVLAIRKVSSVPPTWRIVLRVAEADAEHLRVFDETDRPVILPRRAAEFVAHKKGKPYFEHELTNIEGAENEFLHYRIEGITPGARLRVNLLAVEGDQERAQDSVRVRVAPFLMTPNDRPVRYAVTADFRGLPSDLRLRVLPGLTAEEDEVRRAVNDLASVAHAPPTDSFWQDSFQSGYAVAPGPAKVRTMVLLARFPRSAGNFQQANSEQAVRPDIRQAAEDAHWLWPNRTSDFLSSNDGGGHPALLGDGIGVFELGGIPDQSDADYGGNMEITWPMPDEGYPLGRAVVGNDMSSTFKTFLREQGIQSPPVELNVDWLHSHHVDDVVYFLPERRVAVPSPALAERLLEQHLEQYKDRSTPVFLKGRRILRGSFSGVFASSSNLILQDRHSDLSGVRPGMYVHVFEGPGRYQTYEIEAVEGGNLTVARDTADFHSFWRSEPLENPAVGSEYIVVSEPLHDPSGRIFLITLGELLDRAEVTASGHIRGDNSTVRWFWRANRAAEEQISFRVLPEVRKLAPSKVIRLPVLFREVLDEDQRKAMLPFTPNLVNGQLFGTTFLMPKPFVLPSRTSGRGGRDERDPFEKSAAAALLGLDSKFVDNYFMFHNFRGEVHCAVNRILEPPEKGPHWWAAKAAVP